MLAPTPWPRSSYDAHLALPWPPRWLGSGAGQVGLRVSQPQWRCRGLVSACLPWSLVVLTALSPGIPPPRLPSPSIQPGDGPLSGITPEEGPGASPCALTAVPGSRAALGRAAQTGPGVFRDQFLQDARRCQVLPLSSCSPNLILPELGRSCAGRMGGSWEPRAGRPFPPALSTAFQTLTKAQGMPKTPRAALPVLHRVAHGQRRPCAPPWGVEDGVGPWAHLNSLYICINNRIFMPPHLHCHCVMVSVSLSLRPLFPLFISLSCFLHPRSPSWFLFIKAPSSLPPSCM